MIRKLGLSLVACLALSACAPLAAISALGSLGHSEPPATAPTTPVAPVAASGGLGARTTLDEKALYAAEAAYNVPANAYVEANKRGLLSPELKARVKPLLVTAYARLKDARAAYRLGNASSFNEAIAAAKQLANSASALIPKP